MKNTEIREVPEFGDFPDEFIHSSVWAWRDYEFGDEEARRWAELVWDFDLSFDQAACQVVDEWRSRS